MDLLACEHSGHPQEALWAVAKSQMRGAHSNKGRAVEGLRPGMWCAGPRVEEPQNCTAGSVPLPHPLPILHVHFGDRRAMFKVWVIGCASVDSSVSTLPSIQVKIVPGGFGVTPPQA